MLTGSKVMTHYVVIYISGDLDLDLGQIFSKVRYSEISSGILSYLNIEMI